MITAKELLLKAADLLEEDMKSLADGGGVRYGYGCIALEVASECYTDADSMPAFKEAMQAFRAMYRPFGMSDGADWFGHYRNPGAFETRIAALRNTAATFN